jgi:hypothetical protein
MSRWSEKFRSKTELAMDEVRADILGLERRIKEKATEILAGAPTKDHRGVQLLKLAYEEDQNDLANAKRLLGRLELKANDEASKGGSRGR